MNSIVLAQMLHSAKAKAARHERIDLKLTLLEPFRHVSDCRV